jgi:hypothetical protein
MTRIGRLVLVCAFAPACGPDKDPLDYVTTAQTNASGPGATGAGTATTGMVEETGDEPTGGSACGMAPSTDAGSGKSCDQWIQDCPDGFKCMPYSDDGDNAWESQKCTPVVPNAAWPGEPCTVLGSGVSGYDSCAEGSMCWNVDPDTCTGKCVEQCKGSPADPICTQPSTQCYMSADALLVLCLTSCDPLEPMCPDGEVCLPNPMDPSSFTCVIDASGEEGQVFDVCEYLNACDPGLLCANPALAEECDQMAAGCCLPFCRLSEPDCPGAGQECLAWYEEGMAPPMYENVGVCGVPQ